MISAVPARSRPRGGDIRARLGLGEREGDQFPAGGKIGKPAVLLLVGAGEEQRQAGQLLHGEDQSTRGADAADLLDREADGKQVATETAVLLRVRQAQDVVAGEELLDVPRELGRPIDLGSARRDPIVGEHPDRVAQRELVVGKAIGRGRGRRRGRGRGGAGL